MKLPAFFTKGSQQRRTIVLVIAISIGIHVLAGIGAGVWIVARYFSTPPATFVAKKSVMLPPKLIDPRMQTSEFEGAAPKPAFDDKMASVRATDFALPDLPNMQMDTIPDPTASVTTSLVGTGGEGTGSGSGSGNGGGGGGNGDFSGINFFGISAQTKSVIVIFDVSGSVMNKADKSGVPLTKIKDETMKMIDGLSINTTFNLFQFVRNYQPFSAKMMAPNQVNKDGAKSWLEKEFRTTGTLPRGAGVIGPKNGEDNGIVFVLDAALSLQPNTIFLISDGSFQSDHSSDRGERAVPWDEVKAVVKKYDSVAEPAKIYFIGFEMKPEDKKEMADIVRKTRGKVREIGKD